MDLRRRILEKLQPEKWIETYADYLYNYTIVRVNDHVAAQEIISETLLSAWRSREKFQGKSSERTWLTSILKRKIIDYYRRLQTLSEQKKVSYDFANPEFEKDWLEETIADESTRSPIDLMENEELRLAILDCFEKLNEQQATFFRLKTIENIDTETICKEYNITPSNLWVIVHRARKAMAECLEKNWFNLNVK